MPRNTTSRPTNANYQDLLVDFTGWDFSQFGVQQAQSQEEEPSFVGKAWNSGAAIAEGITMLPGGVVDTVCDVWRGGDIDVNDADALHERQEREREQAEYARKYQGKAFEGVTDAMLSIPYSLTTMGASLGGGVAGAVAGPIGAGAAGMAAGGTVAYRVTKQQFLEQMLDKTEQALGRMPTQEEWDRVAAEFDSEATQMGLWEAGPEALSNLFMAKLLGSLGKNIFRGGLGNGAKRIAGLYGEEFATETATEMGQGAVESEVGLRDTAPGVWEAFRDIAPATFWQTTLMGGGKKAADLAANRMRQRAESAVEVGADETPPVDTPSAGVGGQSAFPHGGQRTFPEAPIHMGANQSEYGLMPMPGSPEDAPREFLSEAEMAETDAFVRNYEAREQAQADADMLSEYGRPESRRFAPIPFALECGKTVDLLDLPQNASGVIQGIGGLAFSPETGVLPMWAQAASQWAIVPPTDFTRTPLATPLTPRPTLPQQPDPSAGQGLSSGGRSQLADDNGMMQGLGFMGEQPSPRQISPAPAVPTQAQITGIQQAPRADTVAQAAGLGIPAPQAVPQAAMTNMPAPQIVPQAQPVQQPVQAQTTPQPISNAELETPVFDANLKGVSRKELLAHLPQELLTQARPLPIAHLRELVNTALQNKHREQLEAKTAPLPKQKPKHTRLELLNQVPEDQRSRARSMKNAELRDFVESLQEKKPAQPVLLGTNAKGQRVFVDEKGVRSYQPYSGIVTEQEVRLIPQQGGYAHSFDSPEELHKRGQTDYLTTDELEQFAGHQAAREQRKKDDVETLAAFDQRQKKASVSPSAVVEFEQEREPKEPANAKTVTPTTGRSDRGSHEVEGPNNVQGIEHERRIADSDPAASGSVRGELRVRAGSGSNTVLGDFPTTLSHPLYGEGTARNRDQQPDVAGSTRTGVRIRDGGEAGGHGRRDSGRTVGRGTGGIEKTPAMPDAKDYSAPVGSLERKGSWKETASRNLDIIELAKRLTREKRAATIEEQTLLAQYTGFGAGEIRNNLFPVDWKGNILSRKIEPDRVKPEWRSIAERAQELLTPEEVETLLQSTQYAHYTSEAVVRSIWDGLKRLGFDGGRILEPGMGNGLFAIAAPEGLMRDSTYTGVEMDTVTSTVAKHLLPQSTVLNKDFTKQSFPDNFFDLAIGNPPFADIKILSDPKYKKQRFSLHDYFFAKSLDKVRPGGLLAFVTSRYTMDKQGDKARAYMADQADLLGAIRLPQTAFKQNAGTEVVTDVLFFRKRLTQEQPAGEVWQHLADIVTPEGSTQINEYFAKHPEMILGKSSLTGSMYSKTEYTVLPADTPIETLFAEAVKNLPAGVYGTQQQAEAVSKAQTLERDFNPKHTKEGGVYLDDSGALRVLENGSGVDLNTVKKLSTKQEAWLKDYVGLRDALKQAQFDQLNDKDWETSLNTLREAHSAFVKQHGNIRDFTEIIRTETNEDGEAVERSYRRFKNAPLLDLDIEGSLVANLEDFTESGEIVLGKFLSGRTIKKPSVPDIKNVKDALMVSLDRIGNLDIDAVAELAGTTRNNVLSELGDAVYENPSGTWEMADAYLSGDVVTKLEEAEVAAKTNKRFRRNVEALLAVQPKPLDAKNINADLGSAWIPTRDLEDFAREIMEMPIGVSLLPELSLFSVSNKKASGMNPAQWGTEDRVPAELFLAALNNRTVRVTRTERMDGSTRTYVDEDATTAANEKVKVIKDAFQGWIWSDAQRVKRLTDLYNRKYNNLAPRTFDGTHLTLPGLSLRYKLYDHQKRAIWRVIQDGNTYLAHAVGAGKTLEMIVSGMEQRRLGLIKRPMYVVPNHMLGQFSSEFLDAYPLANIMVADEKKFGKENRRRFIAQATLNAPDAVIITHSAFGLIGMKPETIKATSDRFINELQEALAEMDDRTDRFTRSRLEKRIEQEKQKQEARITKARDNAVYFEDMGVDFVYLDEAHEFRKLDFVTMRDAVKGVNPIGSARAMDLYAKLTWLREQNSTRSHVFASGTPVTNTMAELFTLMRYMDPDMLERDGIANFDAWASMFGRVSKDLEQNAAGRYEYVERFAKFTNVPELMKRVRSFMDVITMEQLGNFVKRPALKDGLPTNVVAPLAEDMKSYLDTTLAARIEKSRQWNPSANQPHNPDPMVAIISDGRLAALDLRFVDNEAKDNPHSKLNMMVNDIIQTWKDTKELVYVDKDGKADAVSGGAQIVFSAVGFGEGVVKSRGFDIRKDIEAKLRKAGIPTKEVAWMSDYKTTTQKAGMFEDMRSGKVRILFGSPQNMGTGVNVQKRLTKLHYLSPPWYPADIEQPHGRILRQGNQNTEVAINWYASKGTYDSTAWGMVARKAKFIEQAFSGNDSVRTLDDISESSQYEMASALAAGDDRAIQLAGLNADVERLTRLQGAHASEQRSLRGRVKGLENAIEQYGESIMQLKKLKTRIDAHDPATLRVDVDGRIYNKQAEAGQALMDALQKQLDAWAPKKTDERKTVTIGELYGEFQIRVGMRVNNAGGDMRKVPTDVFVVYDKTSSDLVVDLTREELGASGIVGRIHRGANNKVEKIAKAEQERKAAQQELERITPRIGIPFAQEGELADKVAEASRLQADLTSTGEESKVIDGGIASASVPLASLGEETGRDATPVKVVDVDPRVIPVDTTNTKELVSWLRSYYGGRTVTINDTGEAATFTNTGLRESAKRRGSEQRQGYAALDTLMEEAVYDGFEATDERHSAKLKGQKVYYGAMRLGNKLFSVRFKLDVPLYGDGLHYKDHRVTEIEMAPTLYQGSEADAAYALQNVSATSEITLGILRGSVNPSRMENGVVEGLDDQKTKAKHRDDDTLVTVVDVDPEVVPEFAKMRDLAKWLKEYFADKREETILSTEKTVRFGNGNLEASLKRARGRDHGKTYGSLNDLVRLAEYDSFEPSDTRHPNLGGQEVYYSAMRLGDKTYAVKIKFDVPSQDEIETRKNRRHEQDIEDLRYKDHSLKKIEIASVLYREVVPEGRLAQTHEAIRKITLGILRGSVNPSRMENGVLSSVVRIGEGLPPRPKTGKSFIPMPNVRRIVGTLQELAPNGPKTEVVHTFNDIPTDVRARFGANTGGGVVEGLYDPKTKTMYLVAESMPDTLRVAEVWIHEATHHGLRNVFPEQDLRNLLTRLWVSAGGMGNAKLKDIARRYNLNPIRNEADRQLLMEEYITSLAEARAAGLLRAQETSLWLRFVKTIAGMIAKMVRIAASRAGNFDAMAEDLLDRIQSNIFGGVRGHGDVRGNAPAVAARKNETAVVGRVSGRNATSSLDDVKDRPLASFSDRLAEGSRKIRAVAGRGVSKDVEELLSDPEMGKFVAKEDMQLLEGMFKLPHWISKEHTSFAALYERQIERVEERTTALKKSIEQIGLLYDSENKNRLNAKEQAVLRDMIWKWDGNPILALNKIEKFLVKGKTLNGRDVLELNPEYTKAFGEWLDIQPEPARVKQAFLQVRNSLGADFLQAYRKMADMSDLADTDLDMFRTTFGNVQNYFPHKRTGKYFVQATTGKGVAGDPHTVVFRKHFDVPFGSSIREEWAKIVAEHKKDYPGATWHNPQEVTKLPEDILGAPIDVTAMEQIIKSAVSKLDGENTKDIEQTLLSGISDILKTRGFGSHSIQRQNIPGFEKDNIAETLYSYKAGLYGWLAKMEAAKDFAQGLGKIDPKKQPRLWEYASQYTKDMLRNSDRIDKLTGLAKTIAFAWYLGGNIKTAMVNATQNIIIGVPRLQMYTTGDAGGWLKSAYDSIGLRYTKTGVSGGRRLSTDEEQLVQELFGNGVINDAFMEEVRGQLGDSSSMKMWNRFIKWMGYPMSVVERFNRASLALAAYRAARAGRLSEKARKDFNLKAGEKMDYEQAKDFAAMLVRDSHYVLDKGNMPDFFRSSTAGRMLTPTYTFRSFMANTLNLYWHALCKEGLEGRAFVAKSLGATIALGGLTAFPFYTTIAALCQGDDGEDWTEKIRKKLPENDVLRDIVCYGIPTLGGVNIGGSLKMETPFTEGYRRGGTPKDVFEESIGSLIGIPYDILIGRTSKVVDAFRNGNTDRAFEAMAPMFIANGMQAWRLFNEGQTTMKGRPINSPGQSGARKLTGYEAAGKALGFQPTSSTKSYDAYMAGKQSAQVRSDKVDEFAVMFLKSKDSGDPRPRLEAVKLLREWNARMKANNLLHMIIPLEAVTRRATSRRRENRATIKNVMKGQRQQSLWGV